MVLTDKQERAKFQRGAEALLQPGETVQFGLRGRVFPIAAPMYVLLTIASLVLLEILFILVVFVILEASGQPDVDFSPSASLAFAVVVQVGVDRSL